MECKKRRAWKREERKEGSGNDADENISGRSINVIRALEEYMHSLAYPVHLQLMRGKRSL
jgi:hypothetical protein